MKLLKDAPDRSAWSFFQTFRGPYAFLYFVGKLIADAFRATAARAGLR